MMAKASSASRKRPWYRFGMRALMGIVLACALVLGGVQALVESYRSEWQAEQDAIAEIQRGGRVCFPFDTISVGPTWLKTLAGPGRAPYFQRTIILYFDGLDADLAKYRTRLKHMEGTIVR